MTTGTDPGELLWPPWKLAGGGLAYLSGDATGQWLALSHHASFHSTMISGVFSHGFPSPWGDRLSEHRLEDNRERLFFHDLLFVFLCDNYNVVHVTPFPVSRSSFVCHHVETGALQRIGFRQFFLSNSVALWENTIFVIHSHSQRVC
jgi:hypothetical protein